MRGITKKLGSQVCHVQGMCGKRVKCHGDFAYEDCFELSGSSGRAQHFQIVRIQEILYACIEYLPEKILIVFLE